MLDLTYKGVELPDKCLFRISPSQIDKFFKYPSVWFKEELLGEKEFKGNTSTVLGSIVHKIAECYVTGEKINQEMIDNYLNKYLAYPDINIIEIKKLYKDMGEALVNKYISHNKPTMVEVPIYKEIKPGIFLAGTCDNLTGDTIVDYKTAYYKPKTDDIPFHYLIQLLAYAYLFKFEKNIDITRVRVVYVVRPTKTLPIRVITVNHQISNEDWDLIIDTITLISLTINRAMKEPSLIPLLFKSMKLEDYVQKWIGVIQNKNIGGMNG